MNGGWIHGTADMVARLKIHGRFYLLERALSVMVCTYTAFGAFKDDARRDATIPNVNDTYFLLLLQGSRSAVIYCHVPSTKAKLRKIV